MWWGVSGDFFVGGSFLGGFFQGGFFLGDVFQGNFFLTPVRQVKKVLTSKKFALEKLVLVAIRQKHHSMGRSRIKTYGYS